MKQRDSVSTETDTHNEMGQKVTKDEDTNEIITERSLQAVLETIAYIKEHVTSPGMFRYTGQEQAMRKILTRLQRGSDRTTLRRLLEGHTIESAAALKMFLLQHLPARLIPARIQLLVLAENKGVTEQTIVNDVLGLLLQEVSGRQLKLILALFDLVYAYATSIPRNELTTFRGPQTLLPIFFDTKLCSVDDRCVASRFDELIRTVPLMMAKQSRERDAFSNSIIREESTRLLAMQHNEDEQRAEAEEVGSVLSHPMNVFSRSRLHPLLGVHD